MVINMKAYNVETELKGSRKHIYELQSEYNHQVSFYGKADIIQLLSGAKLLRSYNTIVAMVTSKGKYVGGGYFSATTRKHQKEFYDQFASNSDFSDVTYNLEKLRFICK